MRAALTPLLAQLGPLGQQGPNVTLDPRTFILMFSVLLALLIAYAIGRTLRRSPTPMSSIKWFRWRRSSATISLGATRMPLSREKLGLALGFAGVLLFGGTLPATRLAVATFDPLFLSAARTFRSAGTPVPGNRPTTTIVRAGPYRYTRNPIYLSFSLLQLGIALWVSSLWLFVTLIPAVTLMSLVVIPREEHYLESRFASDYLPYKASVRRWL